MRINIELFIPGYCYDELAMVSVARQSFPFLILKQAAILDYHAPLYYLIVHFFTYLPKEWFYLRFFNLILSIINIIVFYLIGKEIKNKKTGLILALFFAVNHLAISTVSFVKFYCLCFLLVSLSILFYIKAIKKPKYLLHLGIINGLYIYSATFGFAFVLIEYLVLYLTDKKNKKEIIKSSLVALLGFVLYLPILIQQTYIACKGLISSHGAYPGAYFFEIVGIFNDYMSPLVNYCCNYDTMGANTLFYTFAKKMLYHKFNLMLFIILFFYSILPSFIALCLNFISIRNNKNIRNIAIVGYGFFIVLLIMVKLEILGLIPIYFYPFGLIFILLTANGITNIKHNKFSNVLLVYLIFIQLIISNSLPNSSKSSDKSKFFYCIEQYLKENNDKDKMYLMTDAGRFIEKYYKDFNIISFDNEEMGGIYTRKYINLLFGKDKTKGLNKYNLLKTLKPAIENNQRNSEFEKYVFTNVINKLNPNQKLTVAFNSDLSTFVLDDELIKDILNSKNYSPNLIDPIDVIKEDIKSPNVNIISVSAVIKSFGFKYLFEILDKNLKIVKVEQYSLGDNFVYKKIYESNNIVHDSLWIAQHANKGWIFITYKKE